MEQENDRIIQLIIAYNKGLINTQDQEELFRWVSLSQYNRSVFEAMTDAESLRKELAAFNRFDTEQSLAEFRQKHFVKPTRNLWPRFTVATAAAAAAIIVFGVWVYRYEFSSPEKVSPDKVIVLNDVAPGKNTATLTLANGKTINLSDAKTGVVIDAHHFKYNDSTAVEMKGRHDEFLMGSRNGKATMLTATTPRGGTYQITLPDGTRVWLNSDSEIRFPSKFSGIERKILLRGEAYFEVTKDMEHPFIVANNGQEVRVLGTHFNINGYSDEDVIKTSLLEGRIKVSKNGRSALLKPGQESIIIPGRSAISVQEADVQSAIAWKNGLFSFKRAELKVVMRQISRWYDVEISYHGEIPSTAITGTIDRNLNISKALQIIGNLDIPFKIEGKKIIIGGK